MSDLKNFLQSIDADGRTHSETPDNNGGTCVHVGYDGYLTFEYFFDRHGSFTYAQSRSW